MNSIYKKNEENKTTTQVFMEYRDELDVRYDLWEKVIKINREITIDSKRLIFYLHRVNSDNAELFLSEAKNMLNSIIPKLSQLAQLFINNDPLQFVGAYSSGLQEFIEASSFLYYLKKEKKVDHENIHKAVMPISNLHSMLTFEHKDNQIYLPITTEEYLLGLSDVTGEAMRLCINSAAEVIGQTIILDSRPFKACEYVRVLCDAFAVFVEVLDCGSGRKKMFTDKLRTMHSSMLKCEEACYTLRVRGKEIPKHVFKATFQGNEK